MIRIIKFLNISHTHLHKVVFAVEGFARELGGERVVGVLQGKRSEVALRVSILVNPSKNILTVIKHKNIVHFSNWLNS